MRQVDSSLLDEWEELLHPDAAAHDAGAHAILPPAPHRLTTNVRAFRILVRNELFRRVQLAALEHYDELGELDKEHGFDADTWADAMDGYFADHDELLTGGNARSADLIMIETSAASWTIRQIFDDPAGDHDWGISAEVDLAASDDAGFAVVRVTAVNRL